MLLERWLLPGWPVGCWEWLAWGRWLAAGFASPGPQVLRQQLTAALGCFAAGLAQQVLAAGFAAGLALAGLAAASPVVGSKQV